MNNYLQIAQDASVALSEVLAPLGVASALWKSLMKHRSKQETEREKMIGQAAGQFEGNVAAGQFFRDLQLQQVIKRHTGLLVMPTEFELVFRFFREEHASFWLLRHAWPYRQPSKDGRLDFVLGTGGTFLLWVGRIYLTLCGVAGVLLLVSASSVSPKTPWRILFYLGAALGMVVCATAMAYTNRSEAAVQRIKRLRKRWDKEIGPPSAITRPD